MAVTAFAVLISFAKGICLSTLLGAGGGKENCIRGASPPSFCNSPAGASPAIRSPSLILKGVLGSPSQNSSLFAFCIFPA